jgi:thiol-disulfide isomerase/thioredoxin
MNIKIFGKQNCDACKSTKEKFNIFLDKWEKKEDVVITFFDLDTVEGLTEGAMLDATDVPTTIIEKDGQEVARWQKKVPLSKDFKELFI